MNCPHKPWTSYAALALLCLGTLLLTGCKSRGNSNVPAVVGAVANEQTEWLCEAGKAADDWDCIQSEDIQPRLEERRRGRTAARSAAATPQNDSPTVPQPVPEPVPAPVPAAAPTQAQAPAPAPSPAPAPASEPAPAATPARPPVQEPPYAKYAYRPSTPVRIVDLPSSFFAAQLLAVSTKEQIEDFVVAQNLYNMSAARIEQDGEVLFVLLLGVYESRDFAERAVAAMPAAVREMKPWIRPIAGLQEAMLRADQLVAAATNG